MIQGRAMLWCVLMLALAVGDAGAQMIVDDFDSQATGAHPEWGWWHNGRSGSIVIDESTYRGTSGKSVRLTRTAFDGYRFGFGRNFRSLDGPAELTFYFLAESTDDDILTVVGGNNADHRVAWWIGVGGDAGHAVGAYSESSGWTQVMGVSPYTWYGVTLEIDPTSSTFDITVWEDGNPAVSASQYGIPFRNGADVDVIDQIQFANFGESAVSSTASAYVDDISFTGTRILDDGFDFGNTSGWSTSTRPKTTVSGCGQVVTTDAVLTTDLVCTSSEYQSYVIDIGASNITLDLDGHSVTGHPHGLAIQVANVEGVTIKNGVIKDSLVGVGITGSQNVLVQDVMVQNLFNTDPEDFLSGVGTQFSQGVVIRDCFFDFSWTDHRTAVSLATSEVTVDNVEVSDGGVGVDISGGLETDGTRATVVNSRFFGSHTHGILVQRTEQSSISNNEFDHCEEGVTCDTHLPGTITGVTVESNGIHHVFVGVHFWANESCSVLDNVISSGWRGIVLDQNMPCLVATDPSECYYATGNLVSGNEVDGFITDLYHHSLATGNTWTENTCETKEGAEIPLCLPPGP
jgi:hypothetical protein